MAQTKLNKTIIVIGGGPSGCMAALSSKQNYPDALVVLLESNPKIGVKLRLTGGGRCNLTADVLNDEIIKHTARNGRFMFSSLSQFNAQSIMHFFANKGLKLKEEDHHRIFPQSNKADDVVSILEKELAKCDVIIKTNSKVLSIDPQLKSLITTQECLNFDALIIATGGISYSHTGSDGSGYELLKSLGHTITDLKPAEVALVSNDNCIQSKELQGLSFKDVNLTSFVNGKKIISITNDLLFTHFGLSGPAALQSSSYLTDAFETNNEVIIKIDFCKEFSLESLQKEKDILEKLIEIKLPKRFIAYLQANYPLHQIPFFIKSFPITIHNTRSFSTAFVTAGGVSLKEIDPKTMHSKIHPWLSVCGETLDVNSLTGGYNMTLAFSSGYTAGKNCLV